ncbi:potassium transporter TrkA [Christiangramia fulva]|uniref:Potassium transporter TrkA n=1 Tax=Christiangramia fulva TaxID=2126553 RepID=A0A2R3Z6T8_9FLAO|nr:TrkA C-terminal domain-containing protein [Christiangramia fulva]AVR45993.1 potassium transporter TrkA [Christiangramia fulva]
MIGIISLLSIILLSLLITRIGAIALVHTGLSKESANLQARSAFTGTGFTTRESEQVVNHPVRRKILMWLIFLGNIGIISTISSLVLSFISVGTSGIFSWETLLLIGGLIGLWILSRSSFIEKKLAILIDWALKKYTNLDVRDYSSLLHLSNNYRVSEILVENHDWLNNKTLQEAKLPEEGILVLGISRENGKFIGAPRGNTQIKTGDTILLYGRAALLESLDERMEGYSGNQSHDDAVKEQSILWEEEDREERKEKQQAQES